MAIISLKIDRRGSERGSGAGQLSQPLDACSMTSTADSTPRKSSTHKGRFQDVYVGEGCRLGL